MAALVQRQCRCALEVSCTDWHIFEKRSSKIGRMGITDAVGKGAVDAREEARNILGHQLRRSAIAVEHNTRFLNSEASTGPLTLPLPTSFRPPDPAPQLASS